MEMEVAPEDETPVGADKDFGYASPWGIFSLPGRDFGTERRTVYEIGPSAPLSDAPIDFNLGAGSQRYVNLKDMQLYLRLLIEHVDGTPLTDKERVAMANYPIATLFQQVDLFLQQGLVCTSGNCYPYKSMLDVLLENDNSDINGELQEGLFYRDSHEAMESTFIDSLNAKTANTQVNPGFVTRAKHSAKSQIFELMGKLHIDLCRQERMLLYGVQMTLRLIQSRDPFRLMCQKPTTGTTPVKECRVKILTATLRVPLEKPTDALLLGHNEGLYEGPAVYPFERSEIKTYSVPAGEFQIKIENVFYSRLPKRIVIAAVDSEAFIGSYDKNPFNFQHFNVNYLCFMIDGVCVPSRALTPEYDKGLYLESYDTLFNVAQEEVPGFPRKTTTITRAEYVSGYTIYCFSLDGSSIGDKHVSQQTVGISKLDIKFAQKLAAGVTIILYATFNAVMRIDLDRNVRVDG